MIPESLARQFFVMHKHFLRISAIDDELGISGKLLSFTTSGLDLSYAFGMLQK
ncbi:hypothetical protein LZF95_16390 [Algoriphagus sp. AGSA1]|uniref:hypothetical protein n=1 Tax=unclassified Algoriphagus TaxID=2641541 RepID=UPI001786EAE9|nr:MULTISPECIES: hypothetical protein [unclassified Algoriphagus]MCE7056263.1 hypothetical protein [Algoriphagus sp. AGSA1]